jgi:hypothetical protein
MIINSCHSHIFYTRVWAYIFEDIYMAHRFQLPFLKRQDVERMLM